MGREIKLIRKQFRITRQEEKQIKEMMREQKLDSFSEFLRQNLLKKITRIEFLKVGSLFGNLKSLNRLVEMCMKF
ncbi:Tn5252%2C orf 10 protein [Streptococcus agalactiae]|nr:Tn5252%2C orf 10 protein [Streptococcus agalactiae]CNG23720.1 Tn5252%2C orf 10 protein [Streptococcus agalactiae]